jgi:hypothetical protein
MGSCVADRRAKVMGMFGAYIFGAPTYIPMDLDVKSNVQSCPKLQYVSKTPAQVRQVRFMFGELFSRGPDDWRVGSLRPGS